MVTAVALMAGTSDNWHRWEAIHPDYTPDGYITLIGTSADHEQHYDSDGWIATYSWARSEWRYE